MSLRSKVEDLDERLDALRFDAIATLREVVTREGGRILLNQGPDRIMIGYSGLEAVFINAGDVLLLTEFGPERAEDVVIGDLMQVLRKVTGASGTKGATAKN